MDLPRTPIVLGIEVTRPRLSCATWPEMKGGQIAFPAAELAELVAWAQQLNPRLVVLQACDGLESEIATELARAELPVAVVDPRQTQQFARSDGLALRTGKVDARMLARFGAETRLKALPFSDAARRVFNEVAERRRQLEEMLVTERNRLANVRSRRVLQDVKSHIAWLEKRHRDIDNEMRKRLKESPAWRVGEDLLQGAGGRGSRNSLSRNSVVMFEGVCSWG